MTATPTDVQVAPRSLLRELLAVLLLTIGSIVPVIPWLVGVALLWTSDRWRVGEKLLATLVWPLGYAPVLFALSLPTSTQSCLSATTPAGATVEKCTSTGMPDALGSICRADAGGGAAGRRRRAAGPGFAAGAGRAGVVRHVTDSRVPW